MNPAFGQKRASLTWSSKKGSCVRATIFSIPLSTVVQCTITVPHLFLNTNSKVKYSCVRKDLVQLAFMEKMCLSLSLAELNFLKTIECFSVLTFSLPIPVLIRELCCVLFPYTHYSASSVCNLEPASINLVYFIRCRFIGWTETHLPHLENIH